MRDVVDLLREGWYGSKHVSPGKEHMYKKPVNCQKLWQRTLKSTNKIFVKICHSLEGTVGSLIIDGNYTPEEFTLPIDTLVIGLTRDNIQEEEVEATDKFASCDADVGFI